MAGGFGFPTALKTAGVAGTPFFAEAATTTQPGTAKQIIAFTVPAATTRTLHTLRFSCRMSGKLQIKLDGVVIAVARTAPGKPDIQYTWFPGRPVGENVEVTAEFQARSTSPIVACEVQVMASDN